MSAKNQPLMNTRTIYYVNIDGIDANLDSVEHINAFLAIFGIEKITESCVTSLNSKGRVFWSESGALIDICNKCVTNEHLRNQRALLRNNNAK